MEGLRGYLCEGAKSSVLGLTPSMQREAGGSMPLGAAGPWMSNAGDTLHPDLKMCFKHKHSKAVLPSTGQGSRWRFRLWLRWSFLRQEDSDSKEVLGLLLYSHSPSFLPLLIVFFFFPTRKVFKRLLTCSHHLIIEKNMGNSLSTMDVASLWGAIYGLRKCKYKVQRLGFEDTVLLCACCTA